MLSRYVQESFILFIFCVNFVLQMQNMIVCYFLFFYLEGIYINRNHEVALHKEQGFFHNSSILNFPWEEPGFVSSVPCAWSRWGTLWTIPSQASKQWCLYWGVFVSRAETASQRTENLQIWEIFIPHKPWFSIAVCSARCFGPRNVTSQACFLGNLFLVTSSW